MAINAMPRDGATLRGKPRARSAPDGERMAIHLMIGFLAVWLLTMITIQFVMAAQHGYGSGFGTQRRVPPELAAKAGVGNDMKKIMAVTNK
jgi:hypothetical protein